MPQQMRHILNSAPHGSLLNLLLLTFKQMGFRFRLALKWLRFCNLAPSQNKHAAKGRIVRADGVGANSCTTGFRALESRLASSDPDEFCGIR
jgi:hypothetical protein